jgi:hypothetical protein
MLRLFTAAALTALSLPYASAQAASAQTAPCKGVALTGAVRDSTQALIPGASLTLETSQTATSGPDGAFRFACIPDGPHRLTVIAPGFAGKDVPFKLTRSGSLDVILQPATTEEVSVDGADTPATSANSAGPSQTVSGSRLQSLADDPDDLARELRQLAAAAGGNPANTTISVDGFQGSSALPPKSSIAYIKINPDQFSAEYREPPFDGGRVEIYTKPGQKTYHGALFLTNGSPWENARDPFSTSKAAIGKQRYGFEFSGPVRKQGSDFALTLEHRSIDNFAVVNAYTPSGYLSQNVTAPQRLWLATARVSWQLGQKNTLISSYSANVNQLQNVGVGGQSLLETGYSKQTSEHMARLSDITTATAHLMHESRLSLRWNDEVDTPTSIAPQVQVSGFFTGGGASIGSRQLHEFNIEWDDDAIYTTRAHTLKVGSEMMIYRERQQLTNNFNGSFTYLSLAQYQANQPYAYTAVTGSPTVNFTQVQEALFVQDDWKLPHNLLLSAGARYSIASQPLRLDGFTPRFGLLWSPTKKGTWTLHAHAGMFTGDMGANTAAEVLRENGRDRITQTVYNPNPASPLTGSSIITSERRYAPGLSNVLWFAINFGGTRTLPAGFNLSADYYKGRIWNDVRTLNINSPLNGQPGGPRPFSASRNIFELQNSGQDRITAVFAGLENHASKRVQFFFGGVHVDIIGNADNNPFTSPQSSTSDAGEYARRSGQSTWSIFGNATFNLPRKLELSANFSGDGNAHYNITTGADNNGDGNFNDRPQYAAPGTPGAIQTPYGLLIASGGSGTYLSRNKGVRPWDIYLDTNLQRAFKITRNAKADHQQTLTLNIRSSNVLNHLNATAIDGVLGSTQFGQAYAADPGRRIEAGARYSF